MERLLLHTVTELWKTRQAVIFDWYDGPRQGVCELTTPCCEFSFDLVAERFNPTGLDDRLFRIGELPKGTVAKVLSLLAPLHLAVLPIVWAPTWRFQNAVDRSIADAGIQDIILSSRQTNILIRTHDMKTFLGCWELNERFPSDADWFAMLQI